MMCLKHASRRGSLVASSLTIWGLPSRFAPEKMNYWRQGLEKTRCWIATQCAVSPRIVEEWEPESRNPGSAALIPVGHLMAELQADSNDEE